MAQMITAKRSTMIAPPLEFGEVLDGRHRDELRFTLQAEKNGCVTYQEDCRQPSRKAELVEDSSKEG